MAGKPGWHQSEEARQKMRDAWARRKLAMQIYKALEAAEIDMGALVTKDGRLVQ